MRNYKVDVNRASTSKDKCIQVYYNRIPVESFAKVSPEGWKLMYKFFSNLSFENYFVEFDLTSLDIDEDKLKELLDELVEVDFLLYYYMKKGVALNPLFFWVGAKKEREWMMNEFIERNPFQEKILKKLQAKYIGSPRVIDKDAPLQTLYIEKR